MPLDDQPQHDSTPTGGDGRKDRRSRGLLPAASIVGRAVGLVRWTVGVMYGIAPALTIGLIAVSVIEGLTPLVLFLAIRGVIDAQAIGRSGGAEPSRLGMWLVILAAAATAEAFVTLASKLLRNLLLARANRDLTLAVLEQAARLPVGSFEEQRSLDTLDRLRSHVAARLVELICRIAQVLTAGIQIITILAALVRIEPLIALVAPPCFAPYLWYHLSLGRSVFHDQHGRAESRRRIAYYVDLLTSARHAAEVRLLGIAPHLVDRFRSMVDQNMSRDSRRQWQTFLGGFTFAAVSLVVFVTILSRVALRGGADPHAAGNIAFFAAAALRLRNSLEKIAYALSAAVEQAGHAAALRAFLSLSSEEHHSGHAALPVPFRPELRCEGVCFRYPGTTLDVLHDLSFDIAAGETVAIVGENGSGKSTLVKLIAGFYRPTAGRIVLSGGDLQDLDSDESRRRIAFVFQDTGRYAASVADNIAYGDWPRLHDDRKAVEQYAERAGLAANIDRMPDGYDTILSRQFGAYEPSGGVWQRIAIARAFAREAPLLILDEPTANVDARAECELFRQLTELAAERTTILISHRFSTVSMADRILVMSGGRIVEQGSHAELLSMQGHYARLYDYHQRRMRGE
jgi:ATP-binding cassette, subfamily B, bacterial